MSKIQIEKRVDAQQFSHPGARTGGSITSHEADASVNHGARQAAIFADVFLRGPGTEETILTRMEFRQRSDASSEISALVRGGHFVNLQDPRTGKDLKLRNTSGKRALVRGLPAHQKDRAIMDALLIQADREVDQGELFKPAAQVVKMRKTAMRPVRPVSVVLGCKRCPVCKREAR